MFEAQGHGTATTAVSQNIITTKIVEFLASIGISALPANLVDPTFLPGVTIECGAILFDETRLKSAGDILHEAGHLAVMPAHARAAASGDVGNDGGAEMSATAWAYAATVHLGLDASVIFHAESYQGESEALISNFAEGRYIGVPYLQWIGMTAEAGHAAKLGVRPYPFMLYWLRQN